ncbi:MAG: DNA methyltransferase Dim-2 [Alyxoria varia]|nr:MAG: DNA methyltransferase Dim-2 [Alyxoria varia]
MSNVDPTLEAFAPSRKRRKLTRAFLDDTSRSSPSSHVNGEEDVSYAVQGSVNQKSHSQLTISIKPPAPLHPESEFISEERPFRSTHTSETKALDDLLSHSEPDEDGFHVVHLSGFEVYRTVRRKTYSTDTGKERKHNYVLAALHDLKTRMGASSLSFDGNLEVGQHSYRVQGVPFEMLSIEGYGSDEPTPTGIYIQSKIAGKRNVWYRLGEPATRYQPYYEPFNWLATFAKHFVNFLDLKEDVCFNDMRSEFYRCLYRKYKDTPQFWQWFNAYGHEDFGNHTATYYEFLWKEASDVNEDNRKHPIWSEIDPEALNAIKQQPVQETKTMVTPFVDEVCKDCSFHYHLQSQEASPSVKKRWEKRAALMNLTPQLRSILRANSTSTQLAEDQTIHVGDIVSLAGEQNGVWKGQGEWFGYVTAIKTASKRRCFLSLIWLYRPSETICANAVYPHQNELFLSDHCNCQGTRTYLEEVTKRDDVSLFADAPNCQGGYFVRQTYLTPDEGSSKDAAFVALAKDHLRCPCEDNANLSDSDWVQMHYPPGTTALVRFKNHPHLEPVIVIKLATDGRLRVKRFLRRERDLGEPNARPNELVTSNKVVKLKLSRVLKAVRACHVLPLQPEDFVPAPYSYGGAGDCWIVTGRLSHGVVHPITKDASLKFIPGFDPRKPAEVKLKGLGLFSGSGGLDRTLEESGAVDCNYAVEWESFAVHTHRANLRNPKATNFYLGSVDRYLTQAISGKQHQLIARLGAINMITAGSPCKGFTRANQNQAAVKSQKHASRVASVLSFINFYLPAYGVLENVFDMARQSKHGPNVFSQVIAALVAMGYQTRVFNLDAWSFGSSQMRSRLFVTIAAPGYTPILAPAPTHSNPSNTMTRAIGKTESGEKYGFRESLWCPFDPISAEESTGDLPVIGKGNVETCVAFPDHRVPSKTVGSERNLIPQIIDRFPKCQSWASTARNGRVPAYLDSNMRRTAEWRAPISRAYQRMDKDRPFPTIRTSMHPDDSRHGQCLHWDQPRMISLMEARRAQSVPDSEVFLGSMKHKFEILGNGVDRKKVAAFGVYLREAVMSEDTQRLLKLHGEDIAMSGNEKGNKGPIVDIQMDYRASLAVSEKTWSGISSGLTSRRLTPQAANNREGSSGDGREKTPCAPSANECDARTIIHESRQTKQLEVSSWTPVAPASSAGSRIEIPVLSRKKEKGLYAQVAHAMMNRSRVHNIADDVVDAAMQAARSRDGGDDQRVRTRRERSKQEEDLDDDDEYHDIDAVLATTSTETTTSGAEERKKDEPTVNGNFTNGNDLRTPRPKAHEHECTENKGSKSITTYGKKRKAHQMSVDIAAQDNTIVLGNSQQSQQRPGNHEHTDPNTTPDRKPESPARRGSWSGSAALEKIFGRFI